MGEVAFVTGASRGIGKRIAPDRHPAIRLSMPVGDAEDIAPLVVQLCSPGGRAITGQLFRPTRTSVGLLAPPQEIRSVTTDAPGWTPGALAAAMPTLFDS
jgi:NAD(P)-dependent dehydrogenase (short-subunit alcohol dehydrogenase family)